MGAGLGLSVVKELSVSLGGDTVLLEGHPGRGSVFKCSLPINSDFRTVLEFKSLDQLLAAKKRRSNIKLRPKILNDQKLLIVEDAQEYRMLLGAILRRAGGVIEYCENIKDAWKAIVKEKFDAIIVDNRLPDGTGEELVRKLRSKKLSTKVIAITGDGCLEAKMRLLDAGCLDVLVKPIDFRTLAEKISYILAIDPDSVDRQQIGIQI